ncbi:MAG: hypothetical protein AAFU73_12570 [Planctomycetota bacterium]
MKTTLPILLCTLPLAPLAVSNGPAQDKIDLTPRYEAGQTYDISQSFTMTGDIDEVAVMVDGQDQLGGAVEGGMEAEGTTVLVEVVQGVRDGKISQLTVTMDEAEVGFTGSVNAMGQGEDFDETVDMPGVGHTVQITIDEDGEIKREDITEDAEPLGDAELLQFSHRNHLDMILPTEPVEEGAPFEVSPDWEELMGEMMSAMDSSDVEPEAAAAMEAMMGAFMDATELEATGTVTGVEEGVATIEYEVTITCSIDDLMGLVAEAMPEEAGQLPPAEAGMTMTAEMTGVATFDLGAGYLSSINMAGEFQVDVDGNMNMGQEIEANAAFSGEFGMEYTVERR